MILTVHCLFSYKFLHVRITKKGYLNENNFLKNIQYCLHKNELILQKYHILHPGKDNDPSSRHIHDIHVPIGM